MRFPRLQDCLSSVERAAFNGFEENRNGSHDRLSGALIPGKNVAALVRSYARLHTSHPQDPPYLLICGSGPCLHGGDLARTLHVETFTEFRAFQNDVSGFLPISICLSSLR